MYFHLFGLYFAVEIYDFCFSFRRFGFVIHYLLNRLHVEANGDVLVFYCHLLLEVQCLICFAV